MDFLEYWDTRTGANKDKSAAVMNLLYDEATILHEWMLEEANTLRARLADVEAQRDGLRRAIKLAIELDVAGAFDHMEILRNALAKQEANDGK